jgi:hypothetical protein
LDFSVFIATEIETEKRYFANALQTCGSRSSCSTVCKQQVRPTDGRHVVELFDHVAVDLAVIFTLE